MPSGARGCLARAAEAEEEAAAAAKERDATAARARNALARAERECDAALPSDDDTDYRDADGTPPDSGPRDLHHALLLHEAAAIVNLHA